MKPALFGALLILAAAVIVSCSRTGEVTEPEAKESAAETPSPEITIERNELRNAYFGDLHIHTRYSFDAYLMGTRASPDDAYRFGKGEMLEHATGFRMKMKKPLDFLSVTDHGFYLGAMREAAEGDGPLSELEIGKLAREIETPADSRAAFAVALQYVLNASQTGVDTLDDRDIAKTAWQDIIEATHRHNEPGKFTTFVGYEYTTGGPEFENLHRNVIFKGENVPELPFTRLDSLDPEDMWRWLDKQRAEGIEGLAIPHNSNGSNGWMFQTTRFDGSPQDAEYAELRIRNEPIVENTQVKGTSDTHPMLSPNDEWADFEIMPIRVASTLASQPEGSYVRDAYLTGIKSQDERGYNPYKFGVIGSSDTHNAAGSFEEDNYWSKTGITDIEPEQRGSVPLSGESEVAEDDPLAGSEPAVAPDGRTYANAAAQYWSASGLAAVWAESNTRDDIYHAFRRKETFSTSGPHIKVRFFGSADFEDSLGDAVDAVAKAYEQGVTMGGDLERQESGAPEFFVWASQDADSASLQRLQVIKGWVENGEGREMVFDVACSDGGEVDPESHRCPDNGAGVDLETCAMTPGKGAAELRAQWQDPDFDPDQRAFYYVRVLENPKCRWSTWDAIRAGVEPRADMHATIQDRAWSSPIWYNP